MAEDSTDEPGSPIIESQPGANPGSNGNAERDAAAAQSAERSHIDQWARYSFIFTGLGVRGVASTMGAADLVIGVWHGDYTNLAYGVPVGVSASFSIGVGIPWRDGPADLIIEGDVLGGIVGLSPEAFLQLRVRTDWDGGGIRAGVGGNIGADRWGSIHTRIGVGAAFQGLEIRPTLTWEVGLRAGVTVKEVRYERGHRPK